MIKLKTLTLEIIQNETQNKYQKGQIAYQWAVGTQHKVFSEMGREGCEEKTWK